MIGDVHLILVYFGENRDTAHQIYKNNHGLWQLWQKILPQLKRKSAK